MVYVSASNATLVPPPGDGLSTVWQSAVTLIGIVLCVAVIVAAVAFACHHRYKLRHRRKKKLQTHQALLSNGVGIGSPIHSIGSSSVNMSFGDPQLSPSKRDYVMPGTSHNAQLHVVGRRDAPLLSPSTSGGKYLARDVGNVDGVYANPYTLGVAHGAYSQNPNLTPHDGHKLKEHRHHQSGHRKQSCDMHDPRDARRHSLSSQQHKSSDVRSPKHRAMSTEGQGPMSPSRDDHRNKSFMSAMNRNDSIPMADAADLSPERTDADVSHRGLDMMQISNEDIPMEPLYDRPIRRKKHKSNFADTCLGVEPSATEQRPPVEGRDSWPRKEPHPDDRTRSRLMLNDNKPEPMDISLPTTPDAQNAISVSGSRPHVKPLPLRNIQKPDGQSPDNQYVTDRNANTPSSLSSGLSPVLHNVKLFSDASGSRSPSVHFQDPDMEYDDIPEIPGSYLTMDPHAYTLTWSSNAGGPGTPSKHSVTSTGVERDVTTGAERHVSNC